MMMIDDTFLAWKNEVMHHLFALVRQSRRSRGAPFIDAMVYYQAGMTALEAARIYAGLCDDPIERKGGQDNVNSFEENRSKHHDR